MTDAAGTTRAPLAARSGPGGFTLIELILVVFLLGLIASVAAPRLIAGDERRAALEAEAVRALLSTVALREATAAEPLALVYDAASETIRVEVRRLRTLPSGAQETVWREDPLIAPVTLVRTELRGASADTVPLGKRSWRIDLPITEPRPSIQLVLAARAGGGGGGGGSGGGARTWIIDLPAGTTAAAIVNPGSTASDALPAAIDLDAAGRGDQPW